MTTLSIDVSVHDGALAELRPAWDALLDEDHPGAPFRGFPWLFAWWNARSFEAESHVLVAREAGQTIGLLPLYVERTRLGGRRLRLMGDGIVGSDYLGVVARPERAAECAAAFSRHLVGERADQVILDDLLEDDPLVHAVAAAVGGDVARAPAERGAPTVHVVPRYRCPAVATNGDAAAYWKGLPGGVGAQVDRRRRWLERRPGYAIEALTAPADVARGMEALFDLHRRRWALEGGSDAIDGANVEAMHRAAAEAWAARGWVRLYMMSIEGAPRAALYAFRHGRRLAYYQAGHDPGWRQRSVGTVLLAHVIADAFAERLDEVDFLRGEEEYKLRFATHERRTVRVVADSDGVRARIERRGEDAIRRLRAAARRALPSDAVAWLRARRRALAALRGGSR
jgi:CelD/BcsL family acetyltransferase involved in cellulose biosynthesis